MASDLAKLVGRNISLARQEMGYARGLPKAITQAKFAQELNEHRDPEEPETAADGQRVSDWERGVHTPSERYMALIVAATGHDESWFYTDHSADSTPDLMGALGGEAVARLEAAIARLQAQVDRLERRERPPGDEESH